MVIAGAGTGKTRVIVERVRHLLATHEDLLPENLLVLTYNVKAARELRERIQAAIGPATAARLTVANFHSFCVQVLTESASEADLPPHPDVLDGIGQFLLLRDLRDRLNLVYHGPWSLTEFVKFINRAKDELVTPADFDAFVAGERSTFEDRYGPYADAAARLLTNATSSPCETCAAPTCACAPPSAPRQKRRRSTTARPMSTRPRTAMHRQPEPPSVAP